MRLLFLILSLTVTPIHAKCLRADAGQVAQVDLGNLQMLDFLVECALNTGLSPWCSELIVPNLESLDLFRCTYGELQIHQLIDPDRSTWKYAFQAIHLVEVLQSQGLQVCEIYNWWRPEPYNRNVHGAPGRHPFGTAVDVRFCSKADSDKAFLALCKLRKAGEQLNAIGYYGGSRLHLGVGDAKINTWGKACPRMK